MQRLAICPNACYSYRKHRKADYYVHIEKVLKERNTIYHDHKGVDGYRSMRVYSEQKGYSYSLPTLHKYMNSELGLKSIVRRKSPGCPYGKPHKTFENKLNQNFYADSINQKWCTDFTYLFLKNGDIRYDCSIIDPYVRSIVASITDRRITSELANRTLQKALGSQPKLKGELILHSDQGAQYTSKAFIDYCESVHVTQSMSKAGYPYDNAPMERYFNTLKNECTKLYEFKTEESLYQTEEEFAYVTYTMFALTAITDIKRPTKQELQHGRRCYKLSKKQILFSHKCYKMLDHNKGYSSMGALHADHRRSVTLLPHWGK